MAVTTILLAGGTFIATFVSSMIVLLTIRSPGAGALSPKGKNSLSVSTCMDWPGAALADVAKRRLPSRLRADEHGALRVIAHPMTVAGFIDRGFGALAQYASADRIAALRFLQALGDVARNCENEAERAVMHRQADQLEELVEAGLSGEPRRAVKARANELRRALAAPDYRRRLRDSDAWLGGSA